MIDPVTLCQQLQQLWQSDFPLSNAMQVQVKSFEDHVLTTEAALAPNTNTHGTAFAGSLYAIEALTAWGAVYLALAREQLDASIIHAAGQIEFAKPIREAIVARCSIAEHIHGFGQLRETGKLRLSLRTDVVAADELCSSFSGDYVIRLNPKAEHSTL